MGNSFFTMKICGKEKLEKEKNIEDRSCLLIKKILK